MTAQGVHVRGSLLKQLRTAGFDKRPTSVDAIPCGDGRISSLHCAVVCIIITNVTVLSWPVVAVLEPGGMIVHALLEHRSMMYYAPHCIMLVTVMMEYLTLYYPWIQRHATVLAGLCFVHERRGMAVCASLRVQT